MNYNYLHGVVGGTFDRFHKGHEKLISTALDQSEQVIIGLATKNLYHTKYAANIIQEYQTREQTLRTYINEQGNGQRCRIVPISDMYGVTTQQGELDVIFVTEDTYKNAQLINEARIKRGMLPLEIILVPFVLGEDNFPITSERIRKGEINRQGFVYESLFKAKSEFILPDSVRNELRNPFGPLHENIDPILTMYEKHFIIAVGDVVARSFAMRGRIADVSVVDFKTQRKVIDSHELLTYLSPHKVTVSNNAGTLTQAGVFALRDAIRNSSESKIAQTLIVTGEEDLLVIPAILLSPLTAIVVYGQFGKGAVSVEVTESKKNEIGALFKKFV